MEKATQRRKLEHIRMVVSSSVEALESNLLDMVRIVHEPLPEIDLDEVDISVRFCGGKKLKAPLMITGMTGGHPDVERINGDLAEIAEKHGIAMGVGSQRAAIEDPSTARTYRIARERAPTTVIVANLGAPQLSRGYGVREAEEAVSMLEADALAIHLNPGQEAYQDEGDPFYSGVLGKLVELSESLKTPIILKETGTGLSRKTVRLARAAGIKCFDVAGLGGTNWIKAEVVRSKAKHGKPVKPAGPLSDYWGNPTAISIVEARLAALDSFIVGSGGIRNGLEAAKAISLGADVAGIALPALRALVNSGKQALDELVSAIIYQVKTVAFMTGSKTVYG
nr:type 2 isopentenyl-diphosphate Delta-isomerase [Desulfurococcales archaeon]